jgi:hypothetical protein
MVGAVAFDLQRSGDGDKAASQAAAENLTRTTAVRATTTSARPTTTIPATTTTAVPVPTPQDIAKANPAGSYKGSSKVTGCSGWGKGSACSGFEGPLQYLSIECPQTGCVASVWGQDFPLTWDGAANVATLKGVDDGVTCNGGKSKLATDLELRLTTVGANWVEGGWLANALTGTLNQRSHGTCGVVAGQTVYSNNPTMKFEMLYGREGP